MALLAFQGMPPFYTPYRLQCQESARFNLSGMSPVYTALLPPHECGGSLPCEALKRSFLRINTGASSGMLRGRNRVSVAEE